VAHWLGSKGATLRSLHAAGIPVPAGFTITTEACRRYFALGHCPPDDLWSQVAVAVSELEAETGRRFAAAPQPLLLAVRSGAAVSMPGMLLTLLHCGLTWRLAEALNDASAWQAYAELIGQLARAQGVTLAPAADAAEDQASGRETCARLLQDYAAQRGQPFPQDADELLRSAVVAVFDSWWSAQATAYRRVHKIDDSLATAVTVQAMIDTQVAGVLFSSDPRNGESDAVVVEAVRGTGERLVSGRVEPERYIVARADLAADPDGMAPRGAGTMGKPVQSVAAATDRTRLAEPLLRDSQLQQLRCLGLRMERLLGGKLDVEWGLAEDRFVIFQARAMGETQAGSRLAQVRAAEIERLERCRRQQGTRLWVPHNLGETLAAPTPLTWDLIRRLMSGRGGLGRLYRSLGYVPSRRVCEHGFLELVAGRIYADPDRLVEMFCAGLPFGYDPAALRANPRLIERSPTSFAPERTDALWLFRLPAILGTIWRAARRLKRDAPRAAERFDRQTLPAFQAYVERESTRRLAELSDRELADLLDDRCVRVLDHFGAEFLRPGLFAGLAVTALETRLVRLLGPEEGGRSVRSLVAGLALDEDAAPEACLYRLAHGQVGVTEFQARCGHRGPNELELAAPRWHEVADEVSRWANWLQASAAPDPAELQACAAAARIRATDALPDVLRAAGAGSFAGLVTADVQAAQTLLPYRQKARHHWMRGYALIREAVLEMAQRRGLGEAIFFLHLEEIRQFPAAAGDWHDVIEDRRQQWLWQQRLTLPDVIDSARLDAIGSRDVAAPSAEVRLEATVLSPGTARGPVWVLGGGRPTSDLRNGCILVCSTLDPGLAPLMLAAGAVVVERGGILSHGAIVARQIGLPAVAVSQATRLLRDGQIVVVDGHQGCVLCLREDES